MDVRCGDTAVSSVGHHWVFGVVRLLCPVEDVNGCSVW